MINKLKEYYQKESNLAEGEVLFYAPKLALVFFVIAMLLFGESLKGENPALYWVSFSVIALYGVIIMAVTYRIKRLKKNTPKDKS